MQRNILLVDDESGITDAIRRMLRAEPWQIWQASNGDQALQILEQQHIHLLITDYKMPGMDGLTLCRKTRERSPATYRLLLSGQVDYAALRRAWQDGDVHRFVAKPWDNLLLGLDIREGLRQHDLLLQSNHLLSQLSEQQPLFLTDENWVLRYVNAPFCQLLGRSQDELTGINLFASTLSAMPVSLETDVTRQTEHLHTWLGDFSLLQADGSALPTRMTISPLGHQFRLCRCEAVTETIAPQRELQDELQRYSGEHHLQRLQQDASATSTPPRLMVVAFTSDDISNRDVASMCFDRLQDASSDLYEIYSPQPHVFLLLLPDNVSADQTHELQQSIRQEFGLPVNVLGQSRLLTPHISLEHKPDHIDCWEEWLRQRLGMPARQLAPSHTGTEAESESPAHAANDWHALPVFNPAGQLVALQLPPPRSRNQQGWREWIETAHQQWQRCFITPFTLIIPAAGEPKAAVLALLDGLRNSPAAGQQLFIKLSEEDLLGQEDDDLHYRNRLREAGCQFLLQDFGRGFLSPRQLLNQPLAGVCLARDFLLQLRSSKSTPQSRRLLQRLQEHQLLICAAHMDNTELLAVAHQNQVDWLSGDLLSGELSADQLQWFANRA